MHRGKRSAHVRPPSASTAHAFTLVELLVSMAVMSILLVILLQTTATSLGLWRAQERKIASGREGRAAVFQMQNDLRNLVLLSNTNLWPQVVGSNVVRFLALQPADFQDTNASEGNYGDLCFVEYRLEGRAIERGSADSKKTFEALSTSSPKFPGAANHQMLATNVLANSWALVTASGSSNVSAHDPPKFLEVYFKIAPSKEAADFYTDNPSMFSGASAKANEAKQQIEDFLLRISLADPVP